jgi:alpha-galactosidase
MKKWRQISGMISIFGLCLNAQSKDKAQLAPAPPMGWNSWDCYGPSVTEAEVKAQADFMSARLAQYGWNTVVVDIQWFEPKAGAHGYRKDAELVIDRYGRLLPALNRFPSAANGKGFKPLADYVHQKGLQFGIHIMRGIPRQAFSQNTPIHKSRYKARDAADTTSLCAWLTDMYGVNVNRPGAQDYYNSILSLYASWGVDYIKADDMSSPYHAGEIEALHKAILECKRSITLSLSPGPAPLDRAGHLRANAQLWRISNDFWDRWQDLREQFDLCAKWAPFVGAGGWPDADMLPLGHIGLRAERGDDRPSRFTRDEQVTLMSLWSIFRSPLMMGGDLPSSDAFTISILTNEEVLAVNQNSSNNRELFRKGDSIAWAADIPGSKSKYLALFNIGDGEPSEVKVSWTDLGLSGSCSVRDLWKKSDLGRHENSFGAVLPAHGSGLYRITPE